MGAVSAQRTFLLASVLVSLYGSPGLARTIQYYPEGSTTLGAGYDPENIATLYAVPCLDTDGVEQIDTSQDGTLDGILEIKQVESRSSLLQILGISIAADASYEFASGSAAYSTKLDISFNKNNLVWAATTSMNFGRFRLKNPRANRTLTNAQTPKDVVRICGPEIVTQETRGVVVSIIFEATDVSSSEREEVTAAISASFSGVGTSASADANYQRAIQKLQQTTNLNVKVYAQGGPGRELLAKVVADPSNLPMIRQSVSEYLAKVTAANAKPLTYQTSPITQFKPVHYDTAPDLAQDRLIEIYDQYDNVTDIIRRIQALVAPTTQDTDFLKTFVPDTVRASLSSYLTPYDAARDQLRTAGVACLSQKPGCLMPSGIADLARISWPDIPTPPAPLLYWGPQFGDGCSFGYSKVQNQTTYIHTFRNFILLAGDQKLFKEAALIENGVRRSLNFVMNPTVLPGNPVVKLPPDVFAISEQPVTFHGSSNVAKATFEEQEQLEAVDKFARRTKLNLTDIISNCFGRSD